MTATTGDPNAEPMVEAVSEPLVPVPAPTAPASPAAASPTPATTTAAPATTTAAPATATAASEAHAIGRPSRGLKALAVFRWLIARSVAIVLFVAGVGLGYSAFLATQAPPAPVVDPATAGMAAPAVVQEFVDALGSNDPGALRSAMPDAPYQLLTAELGRWNVQRITGVETLSTFVAGPRSATELILTGIGATGSPVRINLVVGVEDGQIASFR